MKPFLCSWIKSGLFLLILPIAARADVTFRGDWADFGAEFQKSGPQTKMVGDTPVEFVAGWGHDHWRMVQEMGPDRIVIERDPTSPGGGAVARIEVRPGDNLGHAGSSERTELAGFVCTGFGVG